MLMRDVKRLAALLGVALILFYGTFSFFNHPARPRNWFNASTEPQAEDGHEALQVEESPPTSNSDVPDALEGDAPIADPAPGFTEQAEKGDGFQQAKATQPPKTNEDPNDQAPGPFVQSTAPFHHEIFGLSTSDKKFFSIDFGQTPAMNPNIIPHPMLEHTWIVVAQRVREGDFDRFTEIACDAVFQGNVLRCAQPPVELPIAPTAGDRCEGDLTFFNFSVGPHDARVFYGPERPYVVFGSNSMSTCFGQFVQDFGILVGWDEEGSVLADFQMAAELQRPPPWQLIEKNWFLFWDMDGQMFVHYDVVPKRAFAKVGSDGSAGPDLGEFIAESDEKCLDKYMPRPSPEQESLHQATNSLRVTMCHRTDPSCVATDENTFIITIYQYKTYYGFHSVYEPYVMTFHQRAPFGTHSMSRRPLWIHGREQHPDQNTSDMFYVTSMSWKQPQNLYHGYLDDELFLAFGIEDARGGGIDLLAGDLLGDLGLCSEV